MSGRNQGTEFERELDQLFAQYERKGVARIRKVDPPTKVIRGRVVFMRSEFLDYIGSWTEQNGRSIAIEAKHTSTPRLELGGDRGLNCKQWENAMAWDASGTVTLILWRYDGRVRITTPAQAMATMQAQGRKSLRWCDAFRIPPGEGFLFYDPLAWARKLIARKPKGT